MVLRRTCSREQHCCLNAAFVYSSLFNQKAGEPFNFGGVTFYNFNGAAIAGVSNFKAVVFGQPFEKLVELYGFTGSKNLTAALENSSRSLTGAVNRYPVDEWQVVDRADRVRLATGIVTNFDLYNRQAKVPRHDSTPGLVKGTPAKRVTRVTHLGRSRVVPSQIRLDKKTASKIRPRKQNTFVSGDCSIAAPDL